MSEQEYLSVEVHREFAERIQAEETRQNKRLDKIEESIFQIGELTTSVKVLASNMENMAKEQERQGERLQSIEDKPAKNWDKLVWAIAGALIAGIIGYVLASVGVG
jgi:aconitase A